MLVAVTGAFGYSGRYIARQLLQANHTVITLTNSPQRASPFGETIFGVSIELNVNRTMWRAEKPLSFSPRRQPTFPGGNP
jgi:nucleoside-diphosphate-sugar epimerase